MKTEPLPRALLDELGHIDACTVANAIETFDVRIRNVGFAGSNVRCMFDDFPPLVGYAATARIRTSEPPMEGRCYYEQTDWWDHILSIPAPRIVVVQDIDTHPGLGSFVGEIHANIFLALGCIGAVTNGAVRDLPSVRKARLQLFAGCVSVSHAFAHIFDFGGPVELGRMKVQPGDLIHGDMHGVQTIPLAIADKIPATARQLLEKEKRLIALCRSAGLTTEKLREEVKKCAHDRLTPRE
jgi:4-hydroxy-4-methyl-2-oxoglutarate aldolase